MFSWTISAFFGLLRPLSPSTLLTCTLWSHFTEGRNRKRLPLAPRSLLLHLHSTRICCFLSWKRWVSSLCDSGVYTSSCAGTTPSRNSLPKPPSALLLNHELTPFPQLISLATQHMLQFPFPLNKTKHHPPPQGPGSVRDAGGFLCK